MPTPALSKDSANFQLPAQRLGADGKVHVDLKAIVWLALPFILNSALNAVLNLTDTWFIAQLSAQATAAMGAIYWASLTFIIFLGGIAIAVQTFAAQAVGANSKTRAAHWLWTGLYGAACVVPIFWLAAWAGPWALQRVGLEPAIAQLAIEYWQPRMWTAPFGTALWTMLSFINGIGKPKLSLIMNLVVAIVNALLNQLFMFTWGMGMAGAAWATGASLLIGLIGTALILRWPGFFDDYPFASTWRFRFKSLQSIFKLGLPTGLFIAFDLIALAFFQLYQTQLGAVGGAATQIVMMLTSIAYMPAVGIGNVTIALATGYMASVGVLIALLSPWLMSLFVSPNDPQASEVIRLGITLAWVAAAYQFFDGLNISSAFCLRAAGDAKTPALMLGGLAWFVFIPLAQMLTFEQGKTWFSWLPGFGLGAVGGWIAACIYIGLLGTILFLRWRSGTWRTMTLR
jgi:multidrug resistance protein, MATE family